MAKPAPVEQLIKSDPDLVDRIFEYIFADPELSAAVKRHSVNHGHSLDKIKDAVREEFNGERCYITAPTTKRQQLVSQVLALFDGRNATEVARTLKISRPTVYRYLKQARLPK
jgi:predicted transcriptional regulator YheO